MPPDIHCQMPLGVGAGYNITPAENYCSIVILLMCRSGITPESFEKMRMTRAKPCEKEREQCFGQREQHSLKVQVRKRLMHLSNMKKTNVSQTQQTEDTT